MVGKPAAIQMRTQSELGNNMLLQQLFATNMATVGCMDTQL